MSTAADPTARCLSQSTLDRVFRESKLEADELLASQARPGVRPRRHVRLPSLVSPDDRRRRAAVGLNCWNGRVGCSRARQVEGLWLSVMRGGCDGDQSIGISQWGLTDLWCDGSCWPDEADLAEGFDEVPARPS